MNPIHIEWGGKMVDFEGFELPVQYRAGVLQEHLHCREAASLFDVSHMGQIRVKGANAAEFLESVTPTDVLGMKDSEARYSLLTNEAGGIIDDCIITRITGDEFNVVLNAGRKLVDLDHLGRALSQFRALGNEATIDHLDEQQLIAIQGPKAAEVLQRLCPGSLDDIPFMGSATVLIDTGNAVHHCFVVRCGYTGEDGFEISMTADELPSIVRSLAAHPEVEVAGLGARDSLRLESGLCLYGSDIDETTTPVEAGLNFALSPRRRETGGFPGADKILGQLKNKDWQRKRVGFTIKGAPARAGTRIVDPATGEEVGKVTSGTFSPSLKSPVSMGYVKRGYTKTGTTLAADVRGRTVPVVVSKMPFVEQRYYRGPGK